MKLTNRAWKQKSNIWHRWERATRNQHKAGVTNWEQNSVTDNCGRQGSVIDTTLQEHIIRPHHAKGEWKGYNALLDYMLLYSSTDIILSEQQRPKCYTRHLNIIVIRYHTYKVHSLLLEPAFAHRAIWRCAPICARADARADETCLLSPEVCCLLTAVSSRGVPGTSWRCTYTSALAGRSARISWRRRSRAKDRALRRCQLLGSPSETMSSRENVIVWLSVWGWSSLSNAGALCLRQELSV